MIYKTYLSKGKGVVPTRTNQLISLYDPSVQLKSNTNTIPRKRDGNGAGFSGPFVWSSDKSLNLENLALYRAVTFIARRDSDFLHPLDGNRVLRKMKCHSSAYTLPKGNFFGLLDRKSLAQTSL